MKKLFSIILCAVLALSAASCGKKKAAKMPDIISPDALITAMDATEVTGTQMTMTSEGVQNDGSARNVKYVAAQTGATEPVTVQIEQFSDALSTTQVWSDYENSRLTRSDMEFVNGVGEDCYIAYPFINVYDRGCFIKISAGAGDSDAQRDMLINLAKRAIAVLETQVSPEAVAEASDNVIK